VSNRDQVLVVDEMSDTADVLRAVLEPRGLSVNRVRRYEPPELPIPDPRPAVVVLDADAQEAPAAQAWHNVPLVVIGQVRITESPVADAPGAPAQRHFLQKPFQFAELVQAVERMIARQRSIG